MLLSNPKTAECNKTFQNNIFTHSQIHLHTGKMVVNYIVSAARNSKLDKKGRTNRTVKATKILFN